MSLVDPPIDASDDIKQMWEMICADDELYSILSPTCELSVPSLQRFLTARKGNALDAFEQFKRCAIWRRDNEIDTVFDRPFLEKEFVGYSFGNAIHGKDKEGRPVFIERMGLMNNSAMVAECKVDGIKRAHIYHSEKLGKACRIASEESGIRDYQYTFLVDLTGFSIKMGSTEQEIFKAIAAIDGTSRIN